MRITFILWRGDIGGAERVTVALAGELRRMGVDADILFVCDPGRLVPQMTLEAVPFAALGHQRGSQVMAHPMRLAAMLRELRPDVVIAVAVGYLGAAVRAVGFRGPIVGVEHGALIEIADASRPQRLKGLADRRLSVRAYDAEVAISHYMRTLVDRGPRARRVVQIAHGVALPDGRRDPAVEDAGEMIIGFAGRLYPGKGVDRLIRALSLLVTLEPSRRLLLRVAGDGEMRREWETLAGDLGIGDRVEFLGWCDDVAAHWRGCHVAVAPNDGFTESFGMSVLEAMAVGCPTIVTDRGALPELVVPQVTGQIVDPGDEPGLAAALAEYVRAPDAIHAHGAAARQRAASDYSLTESARRYLELAGELLATPRGQLTRPPSG